MRRTGSRPEARSGPGRVEPQAGSEDRDRHAALELVPVSRETESRLALYVDLLRRWQAIKNLVGPSTLAQAWTRHIADSAQIVALAPHALIWADLGSGAGLPGLVVAILQRDRPGTLIHLIESNGRKCAFLREAVRATGVPALVHHGRVEDVLPGLEHVDVLTSRALAPLPALIEMGKIPLARGASAIFLKSEGEIGVTDLSGTPGQVSIVPSKTSPDGRIVLIGPARTGLV